MKQASPTITRNEILNDLITTTTSLNGIAAGTWSSSAGYGLVNAVAALKAAQVLKVTSITPGSSQTLTTVPQFLTVTSASRSTAATLSAADLRVTGPNGSTVVVGAPIAVDSPTFPTIVNFPITIIPAARPIANGTYTYSSAPVAIIGENGTALTGVYSDKFVLAAYPGAGVVNTSFVGRIVTLTFNEAVNPASVSYGDVYLFRTGGANNPVFGPNDIVVSQLPGAIFNYNPATFTVTIDLTAVPQSSLPTDHYVSDGDQHHHRRHRQSAERGLQRRVPLG